MIYDVIARHNWINKHAVKYISLPLSSPFFFSCISFCRGNHSFTLLLLSSCLPNPATSISPSSSIFLKLISLPTRRWFLFPPLLPEILSSPCSKHLSSHDVSLSVSLIHTPRPSRICIQHLEHLIYKMILNNPWLDRFPLINHSILGWPIIWADNAKIKSARYLLAPRCQFFEHCVSR